MKKTVVIFLLLWICQGWATLNPVRTIVIDPGHGGFNLGAHFVSPFCEEKRLTLLTSRLIKKYLTQLGYHVLMTRAADSFIPLSKRVEIANQAHSDLFVSVHYNSSRSPFPKGIEIFYSDTKENVSRANLSQKLASSILTRVLRRTMANSRGVKKSNFYVTRETRMPSVLVEGGFISNVQERCRLKDPIYLEKMARGIAEGIDAFCHGNVLGGS